MPGRTGGVPRDTTVQIVVDGLSNPPMSVIEFELTIGEKKVRRLSAHRFRVGMLGAH